MTTYTIVSASKTPLGPGEINAGQTITVNAGDVFVFGPGADGDVNFAASSGGPHDFDIVFNDPVSLKVTVGSSLKPTVTIGDDTDLSGVDLDAIASDGLTLTAGNNVSLGKLDGSGLGNDLITLGDSFTATGDWNTTGGDDTIIAGDDATFVNIKTGSNSDTIILGDRATFNQIDTESGADTITIDDFATGQKIVGGSGNDTVFTGTNENIAIIDGGSGGDDAYTSQDPGSTSSGFETVNFVCFLRGTLIRTSQGLRAIEDIAPGDRIWTRDRGLQPVRWAGVFALGPQARDDDRVRPVSIRAGALGPGVPRRDLRLSQQHRVLLRSPIVARMFGVPEILVAAKKLVGCPGIAIAPPGRAVVYHHLLFDRHEVLMAEGAETESLLLAKGSLETLSRLGSGPMRDLADRLARAGPQVPARPIVARRAEIGSLIARSQKNPRPLQCPAPPGRGAAPEAPGRGARPAVPVP